LILFSCEIELTRKINCKMNKLIIDAAKDKIFQIKEAIGITKIS